MLMADLHHLPKSESRRRVDELLERFDLVEAADKFPETYSGGCNGVSISPWVWWAHPGSSFSTSRPRGSTRVAGTCGRPSGTSPRGRHHLP